uniref:Ig-like domain-containing protein n=1 Tax=Apteryx owenii TaxID=8824 RepID=A0A8B9S7A6_APTOW
VREVQLLPEPGPAVPEKTDVTLRCRAAAWPQPGSFEWFRDGRPLGRGPQDLWVLRAAGAQASGRYRCRATNSLASADSPDVAITVYCKGPRRPGSCPLSPCPTPHPCVPMSLCPITIPMSHLHPCVPSLSPSLCPVPVSPSHATHVPTGP